MSSLSDFFPDIKQVLNDGFIDNAISLIDLELNNPEVPGGNKIKLSLLKSHVYKNYMKDEAAAEREFSTLLEKVEKESPAYMSEVFPELLSRIDADEDYKLSASWINGVAKLAFEKGKDKLALKLLSGFAKKYPNHQDVVENNFLVAKILMKDKRYPEKAVKILKSLVERYPKTELIFDIRMLLKSAEKALERQQSKK